MSRCTVHVVVAPAEEVVLHYVQILSGVRELKLVLYLSWALNRTQKGVTMHSMGSFRGNFYFCNGI